MTIRDAAFVELVRLGQRGREWGHTDEHIADRLAQLTGDPWTAAQVAGLLATLEAQRIEYWQGAPPPVTDPFEGVPMS